MSEWIRSILDLLLIGTVGAGVVQATRLIRHLAGLRQGRLDMERFVHEFNTTVLRAEAGIKNLRTAARDTGDDLEKLVEKAVLARDELTFIVNSADQIAERLSVAATNATRGEAKSLEPKMAAAKPKGEIAESEANAAPVALGKPEAAASQQQVAPQVSSRAEKELLQALQKMN